MSRAAPCIRCGLVFQKQAGEQHQLVHDLLERNRAREHVELGNLRHEWMEFVLMSLPKNPQIKSIDIKWNKFHSRKVVTKCGVLVGQMPALESLRIYDCSYPILSSMVDLLGGISQSASLQRLHLRECELDSDIIGALESLVRKVSTLRELLIVQKYQTDPRHWVPLLLEISKRRLRKLRICEPTHRIILPEEPDCNPIDYYWAIGQVLNGTRTLQELHLENVALGDRGAGVMANALRLQNRTLRVLNLKGNQLGRESATALGAALEQNIMLTRLELNNNLLSGCLRPILRGMQRLLALKSICLDQNELNDDDAVTISEELSNTGLMELQLNDNSIGDRGVAALAPVLVDCSLEILGLSHNYISTEGFVALATHLPRVTNLSVLGVVANDYSLEAEDAMLEALKVNTSICRLSYLSSPQFSYYTRLNEAGRGLLGRDNVSPGLWTHVLAKHHDHDVVYYFLKEKPELCSSLGGQ